MGRYAAMRRQWEQLPPLSALLAAHVGWKPPKPSAAAETLTTEQMFQMARAAGIAS